MYYVVQFTNDGDIAVVPRSWWTNDATAWPPYKGHRLTRAIKDCEQPSVDWVSYPCRVMASSSTYEGAKYKEKKAEDTSDLATEDETSLKRKRKPSQRILSSSEDEETCEALAPDNVTRSQHPTEKSVTAFIPPPAPPKVSTLCNRQSSRSTTVHSPSSKRTRTAFEKQILRVLGTITVQLENQAKILRKLETQRGPEHKGPAVNPEMLELLPLSSSEDVVHLERCLAIEGNIGALAAHLSLLGGSSLQDVVRTIMKRCMLDTLAEKYCMTGRKGKLPMLHLKLFTVVREAVRKCFEVKKRNGEEAHLVQDSAIMKATADWLRYAPARVKKNEHAGKGAPAQE